MALVRPDRARLGAWLDLHVLDCQFIGEHTPATRVFRSGCGGLPGFYRAGTDALQAFVVTAGGLVGAALAGAGIVRLRLGAPWSLWSTNWRTSRPRVF